MDSFWHAAAAFLKGRKEQDSMVVAPEQFHQLHPVRKTYGDVEATDAERVDVLVLHKGLFDRLDRNFVRGALERLRATFANEVFIVLTAGGELLDAASPHLDRLADIRRWANGITGTILARPTGDESLLFATDGRYGDPLNISQARAQVYSQNNEDGILAEIFRRIGIRHRTFVEIGVENGLQNNTRFLLEQGWQGIWIDGESHAERARDIFAAYVADGSLKVIGAHVTAENINGLLEGENGPREVDLLSLDIDQNTTHVWRAFDLRARVCCIEYNASLPPSLDIEAAYDAGAMWDGSNWYGGSLKTIENIGREKNMSLVGCDLLGVNAFLVAEAEAKGLFREPFTAESHYEAPKFHLTTHIGHPPSRRPRPWVSNAPTRDRAKIV